MYEPHRLAGYAHLIDRFGLRVRPNWHTSAVARGNSRRRDRDGDRVSEVYPASRWPGDTAGDHIEFALKYDGTNLHVLDALFAVIPSVEIEAYVRSAPLGKYVRRAWYLYEWCTGRSLQVDPIERVAYLPLVEPAEQYTGHGRRVARQRIEDNLLGTRWFCPVVRRTEAMETAEASRLDGRTREVVAVCPPDVLLRAMHYLYTKETQSSFEIEREEPSADRVERFVSLLHAAERDDFVDKARLVQLQNLIVDPRFREDDYRRSQNYVGETVRPGYEKVHFIPPRPGDVPSLMDGWTACHRRMEAGGVHPVVHAAVVAFGFVFIHPFEDGNGRGHRFLIHNVLARRAFTPTGMIFPVSAVMLKDRAAYDRALEAFSGPLVPPLVESHLDDHGRLTVRNDTAPLYRFMDMTAQAEALFAFVGSTIDHELVEEIRFVRQYDLSKLSIQAIVDAPDRLIDLFIRCCTQNHGRLAKRKREAFAVLTDAEIAQMERAIAQAQADVAEANDGDDDVIPPAPPAASGRRSGRRRR